VRKDTELIDYDEMEAIALQEKPKVIIGGGSAYPRFWDFERMRHIATRWAHNTSSTWRTLPGWWRGGVHPSPVPHAHIQRPRRTRRCAGRGRG